MKMKGINMNINFNKIFLYSLPFLYITMVTYIISTILFFILPKTGVNFTENSNVNLDYKKYRFYLTISNPKIEGLKNGSAQNLDKYNLKAIFSTQSNGGLVVIEEKSSLKDNLTLNAGEDINGYLLTKLYKDYVLFTKDGKEYILKIDNENKTTYELKSSDKEKNNNSTTDNKIILSKSTIKSYMNNLEEVSKNIILKEFKSGDSIDGFKIEKIVQNSDFSKLGLKDGDIIKSVNSSKLSSYGEVYNIFNNIDNISYLSIEVLRNNEIVELNYEINY